MRRGVSVPCPSVSTGIRGSFFSSGYNSAYGGLLTWVGGRQEIMMRVCDMTYVKINASIWQSNVLDHVDSCHCIVCLGFGLRRLSSQTDVLIPLRCLFACILIL